MREDFQVFDLLLNYSVKGGTFYPIRLYWNPQVFSFIFLLSPYNFELLSRELKKFYPSACINFLLNCYIRKRSFVCRGKECGNALKS